MLLSWKGNNSSLILFISLLLFRNIDDSILLYLSNFSIISLKLFKSIFELSINDIKSELNNKLHK